MIADVKADKVVFLGDYFDDDDGDTPEQNHDAANWLRESIMRNNRIHLWGSREASYVAESCRCEGWTPEKQQVISSVMRPRDWGYLRWYTWVDDHLVTHAGLHRRWMYYQLQVEELPLWLDTQAINATRALASNTKHWMLKVGRRKWNRGYSVNVGGLLWLDWDTEFRGIRRLNQIVGHSRHPEPQARRWHNWCLDAPGYAALVEDRKVNILKP